MLVQLRIVAAEASTAGSEENKGKLVELAQLQAKTEKEALQAEQTGLLAEALADSVLAACDAVTQAHDAGN